jgi:hypothetical protein
LAVVEVFHSHPHELLEFDVDRWLAVQYVKIPLLPLGALGLVLLARGCAGIGATVCRVALFVLAVSSVVFDTGACVVTGIPADAVGCAAAPIVSFRMQCASRPAWVCAV